MIFSGKSEVILTRVAKGLNKQSATMTKDRTTAGCVFEARKVTYNYWVVIY